MSASATSRAFLFALTLAALGACGSKATWPAGSYALDMDSFVDHAARALIASGQIPPEAEQLAHQELRKVQMQLELLPGGEFSCDMGTPAERHVFTGTWQLDGSRMSLHQTHQDGEPVTDSMSGTLEGNVLRMEHDENGMKMVYVLHRESGTPASPR